MYTDVTKNDATSCLFSSHRFRLHSWRINLREWHSQRTPRLLPELLPFSFLPAVMLCSLLLSVSGPSLSLSLSLSLLLSLSLYLSDTTHTEIRARSRSRVTRRITRWKKTTRLKEEAGRLFSCVSGPRCGRSSPAALSCSSRYRLGYVYDSS